MDTHVITRPKTNVVKPTFGSKRGSSCITKEDVKGHRI